MHDLEQMRVENNDLKLKLDGRFGEQASRVGEKRPAEEQLDRMHEVREHVDEGRPLCCRRQADRFPCLQVLRATRGNPVQ